MVALTSSRLHLTPCSYTSPTVGARRHTMREALAAPHADCIFFAGEATSTIVDVTVPVSCAAVKGDRSIAGDTPATLCFNRPCSAHLPHRILLSCQGRHGDWPPRGARSARVPGRSLAVSRAARRVQRRCPHTRGAHAAGGGRVIRMRLGHGFVSVLEGRVVVITGRSQRE